MVSSRPSPRRATPMLWHFRAVCRGLKTFTGFFCDPMQCWVRAEVSGRGNFAVVGRQKSLFFGALIGPKSLFCFTLNACNFEICAARSCNKKQQKTPHAQQYTSLLLPCAHGKLNVKHYRTSPKPETHVTSRGRSCAGEKIENRAPKRIQAQQQRHSHHHPPPPRLPPSRQQGT